MSNQESLIEKLKKLQAKSRNGQVVTEQEQVPTVVSDWEDDMNMDLTCTTEPPQPPDEDEPDDWSDDSDDDDCDPMDSKYDLPAMPQAQPQPLTEDQLHLLAGWVTKGLVIHLKNALNSVPW